MPLTGKQRHHLRALAHHLEPVVQVGHDGVSPPVLAQVEEALAAHELVKVRLGADTAREQAAQEIASATHAEIAQLIGRVVVLFRRRQAAKKKTKISLLPGSRGGQKGSKGRPPSQRAKAKAKTAAARSAKRKKLARARATGERAPAKRG